MVVPQSGPRNDSIDNPLLSAALPAREMQFPRASNLLARALHAAFVGDGPVNPETPMKGDISAAVQLLRMATPLEVEEADRVMHAELGYGIESIRRVLRGPEAIDLGRAIPPAALRSIAASSGELRRAFLLQAMEQATIFPPHRKYNRPTSISEKLEILREYTQEVDEGLRKYPEILGRWADRGLGEGQEGSPIWLARSIRLGVWQEFGTKAKTSEVLHFAAVAVEAADRRIAEYQGSLAGVSPEELKALITDLDVTNRIAIDFAMDLCEDSNQKFRDSRPDGIIERIFRSKSIDACSAAFQGFYERYVLVKRAVGVRAFVAEMRESLSVA